VSELERVLAFLKTIDERASTLVERFRFGTACFHPELPRVWSRNFVWVDAPIPDQQLESLLADADRLHTAAGLDHRKLVFADADSGSRAGARLAQTGWQVQGTRVMVHGGSPGEAARAPAVREVEVAQLRAASDVMSRNNPRVADEATVAQLRSADDAVAAATHERCFAAVVDGSVVSYCRLFSDGEIAQVEEVSTLPAFRNRGYAGAVVSAALSAASEAHGLIILLVDEGEWPERWYERIGFQPIAVIREALKT